MLTLSRSILSRCALCLVGMIVLISPLAAQWRMASGVSGGVPYAFAESNGVLLAGTGGGVYRSTDGGITWSIGENPTINSPISHVVSDGTYSYAADYRLFRSGDDGLTWERIAPQLPAWSVRAMTTHNGRVFIAMSNEAGLFRSADGGEEWTRIGRESLEGGIMSLVSDGDYLFAASGKGAIYRSSDDGDSWISLPLEQVLSRMESLYLAGGMLFINLGWNDETRQIDLLRSSDHGATWTLGGKGLPRPIVSNVVALGNVLYCGTVGGTVDGIYRSFDMGDQWYPVSGSFPTDRKGGLWRPILHVYDVTLLASVRNGLYRSSDAGSTWSVSVEGMMDWTIESVVQAGTRVLGATSSGLLSSEDGGRTWTSAVADGAPVMVDRLVALGETLFLMGGEYSDSLYRSDDGGLRWEYVKAKPFPFSSTRWFSGDVPLLGIDGTTLVTADDAIFQRSIDLGKTWTSHKEGLPKEITASISELGVGRSTIYAGTNGYGLYRSIDGGLTWDSVDVGFSAMAAVGRYPSVTAIRSSGSMTYVATHDGLYRSGDGGNTWLDITAGQPLKLRQLTALLVHGDMVFVSSPYGGLYFSPDAGDHWYTYDEGLYRAGEYDYIRIRDLWVVGDNLLATTNLGFWFRPLPLSGVDDNHHRAGGIAACYPNPFTGSTSFWLTTNGPEKVTLDVFDLLGNQLRSVSAEYQSEGTHELRFDAAGLAAGTYHYRVRTSEKNDHGSIVIQR